MWADPDVVRLMSGHPSTPAQSWSRVLQYAGLWHHLRYGYWAVCDKHSDVFYGEVGYADFKRTLVPQIGGVPEIGWAFHTQAQGLGYAREAVHRILVWADQSLGYSKTYCIFDPSHARSLKLAEDVGYKMLGTSLHNDKDVLVMSRTKERSPASP